MNPAVIVPVYRFPLQSNEKKSLEYLFRFLSDFDIIFVSPDIEIPLQWRKKISRAEIFDNKHFSSVESYSRLLMSDLFYRRFDKYSHILIYQLDCLVFSNDLLQWCETGWDYIGAPWLQSFIPSEVPPSLWATGNGGLSLRSIEGFRSVLSSPAPKEVYSNPYFSPYHGLLPVDIDLDESKKGGFETLLPSIVSAFPILSRWKVADECQRYMFNEDAFWSFEAHKFKSDFKVSAPTDALRFAFEKKPAWCYEQNGRQLPFGCHAWARYDLAFWERLFPDLLLDVETL
jgi:hypothetical protein